MLIIECRGPLYTILLRSWPVVFIDCVRSTGSHLTGGLENGHMQETCRVSAVSACLAAAPRVKRKRSASFISYVHEDTRSAQSSSSTVGLYIMVVTYYDKISDSLRGLVQICHTLRLYRVVTLVAST